MSTLRLVIRGLARYRAPNLLAILALGLGIGLTSTMFSIVYGIVWRGLPFERSEQLMHLARTDIAAGVARMRVTVHDFTDWRAQQQSFEDLAAFYNGAAIVAATGDTPERLDGTYITPSAFRLLRVRPLLGRVLTGGEQGADATDVAILSYHVWRDLFASDPAIVGRAIQVNAKPTVVIGVMPDGFGFPYRHDLWMPLRLDAARTTRGEGEGLEVFGRLRDGIALSHATAEMRAIAARLATQHPETNANIGVAIVPYTQRYFGDQGIATMYAMLGAVFGVLLVACVNVTNLLLAHVAHRTRQMAMQRALGATRWRIVLQLLLESLVLALLGVGLGIGLATLGVRLFNLALIGRNPPFWLHIEVDTASLLFTVALGGLSAIVAGIMPAFRAARTNVIDILKEDAPTTTGRRVGRFTRALLAAELAISCALLAGSALMIRGVIALQTSDWGFPADRIVAASLALPEPLYAEPARQHQLYDRVLLAAASTPGIERAALATALPALGAPLTSIAIEGQTYASAREYPRVHRVAVTSEFFTVFDIPLLQGRAFGAADRDGAPLVAVVNASFAARRFPGQTPIGRRFRLSTAAAPSTTARAEWLTVIGVVADARMDDVAHASRISEGYYVPLAQSPASGVALSLRVQEPPNQPQGQQWHEVQDQALRRGADVRRSLLATDPHVAMHAVRTMREAIDESTWFYGLFANLFAAFGVSALVLAIIGLYGVLMFSVRQRTREIGVRMVLGARAADVTRLVLGQILVVLVVGLAIGLLLAVGLGRMLAMFIFGLGTTDQTITFIIVVATLTITSLTAAFLAARHAARIDPNVALRNV